MNIRTAIIKAGCIHVYPKSGCTFIVIALDKGCGYRIRYVDRSPESNGGDLLFPCPPQAEMRHAATNVLRWLNQKYPEYLYTI